MQDQQKSQEVEKNPRKCCCKCYQKCTDKIPARFILYFLSLTGFTVAFMMRNDMNFALVAMTSQSDNEADQKNSLTFFKFNTSISSPTYNWPPIVKSWIISSFYVSYVLAQIGGGVATQYFGTKNVFGWSQFVKASCNLIIPWITDFHYAWLIVIRSIQGVASGVTWPAMYAAVGHWIPFEERSRFMSSFQGLNIGIGLTYPLCGFLIDNFGWRFVFITTGSLGILWCIAWYFLAFNTPQDHPRITVKELKYIEERIDPTTLDAKNKTNKKSAYVPWFSIVKSLPAWVIGITTFGRIWIQYIFIVSGPNFMKNILNFDYQKNGFLSGIPFFLSFFASLAFCYIADKLLSYHLMKLTNIRKLFTAISQVIPGILLCFISYIKNITILLILWWLAVILIAASYAGAMANIVDISPNYAGQVLSFCQTIHMIASFLSPLAAGIIVKEETSIKQWRIVFLIGGGVGILTYIFYQIWGTAEIQEWNRSEKDLNKLKEESKSTKL